MTAYELAQSNEDLNVLNASASIFTLVVTATEGPQGPPGEGGGAGGDVFLDEPNQFTKPNTFNGTPNIPFPQRVGKVELNEGSILQSGNGDTTGTGTPRIINRFDSTQTDTDAVGWGLSYTNAAPFTTSDLVEYRDHVYVLGINAIGSGLRIDVNKPYLAMQFESKYSNSTSLAFGSEWHIEHRAPGAGAPNLRAMSLFLPFDLTQRGLGAAAWSVDTHLFQDQLGVTRMQWNLHTNSILMLSNTQVFDGNNRAPLQQRNAANSSYLNLPYIDNLDRTRISSGINVTGAVTAALGGVGNVIQGLSWSANNQAVVQVTGAGDAVSGSKNYGGFQSIASINGVWYNSVNNTFAGGEAVWDTLVSGTGGKAKTVYRTFSQGGFDVGFDGVTDTFIISRAQGLGIDSLTYVTMTRASNVPANSVWTHRGSVIVSGSLRLGTALTNAPTLLTFSGSTYTTQDVAGRGLTLYSRTVVNDSVSFALSGDNHTQTSGTTSHLVIARTFAPTSGTAVHNLATVTPTVNQTGGANGITRGLLVNPTLTAAADFRGIEIGNCGSHKALVTGTGLVQFGDAVQATTITETANAATGTGGLVRVISPSLVTPALGNATATSLVLTDGLTLGVRTEATLPLASTVNGQSFRVSDSPVFPNRTITSHGTGYHYHRLVTHTIVIKFDSTTTGLKLLNLPIDFDCVITGWELAGNGAVPGDLVVDILKASAAGLPAVTSITGSAKPTLSSQIRATSTTLTGWTPSITAGDYLEVEVESVTTFISPTLKLTVARVS